MKYIVALLIISTFLSIDAQDKKGGEFEFGFRSTASLFSIENTPGFGAGSQFRLRLGNRLNTEWYADLLKNNIEDLGSRTDSHIGWSVMFYPKWYKAALNPYFIAGHCFDYTKVTAFATSKHDVYETDRWSSAVQAGMGTSWNFSKRVNLSLAAQYMMHLGGDIHADIEENIGTRELHVEKVKRTGAEGHLLVTLSMNILIIDIWTRD